VSTILLPYRSTDLAWSIGEDEDQRYRHLLKRTLQIFLVLAILLTLLPTPKIPREQVEELPPQLAKLLLERQTPPPPPVTKAPEPELKKPEAKKPEVKKKEEPKKQTVEAARAKAEKSGLLAFKDELSDLRSVPTSKLDKAELAKGPVPAAGKAGSGSERSLITSSARSGSGGINTARLSRDTGGGGLGARSTGQVASPVGGGGGDGQLTRGGSGKAARSLEDIKLVFDRNKGAIYTIYNRALREDPSLQGKVVVKLTISPAGQVLDCRIVSSELRNPELERKLVARIKQFDFGAKAVDTMVVTYPIDFLPS
jgi:TonB family protein